MSSALVSHLSQPLDYIKQTIAYTLYSYYTYPLHSIDIVQCTTQTPDYTPGNRQQIPDIKSTQTEKYIITIHIRSITYVHIFAEAM